MQWSFTLKNIKELATSFWKYFDEAGIFAFHGEMGAGKTTFIHALCDARNVKDTVSSPTFSIINEYCFEEHGRQKKIYHIDLYRLKDEEEAINAGVEDCLYSSHTCFIEWPEKAAGILPEHTVHVYIETTGPENRRLQIAGK